MVRVEAPPSDQASPSVRALVLPAVLIVAATAAAVALVPDAARIPLVVYGAIATIVVTWCAGELSRRARTVSTLHEHYAYRLAQLERRLAQHDEETVRLGKELMPATIHRLRQGESPDEVIRAVVDGDERYRELPTVQRSLLRSVLQIVDDEEAMRESAQRSFVNIARRVQSIVHQQASELREMEEAHGRNPEVFDDLLRIDHGTALIGRLADSIAVLGKARPGRQWPRPVPLFSVLRGAMSRILEYQRVDLHSIAKVAIIGTAVEPLIHACAELLDNATRYSPPQTRVHVTAVEVQTGIAIEIEDGGVSLSEEARARAETMLAQAQAGIDLNDLGETPRLGMAVVGRLCQMYNLQVSLRQSAYGGVRAVLIVPRDVVTTGPAPGIAHGIGASALPRGSGAGLPTTDVLRPADRVPRPATGPQPSAPVAGPMEDDIPVVTEWTENGLPQRRSRGRAPLGSHNLGLQNTGRAPAAAGGDGRGDRRPPANGLANGRSNGYGGGYGGSGYNGGRGGAPDDAQRGDGGTPEKKPGPGIWLEAFTKAVNGTPREPSTGAGEAPGHPGDQGESDDVWGKGDLK
ncbi:ATP-binding protein [Streptomyces scopuliridis]|uniref:ATP-binding protein n=1 Tax=Streptomyces scopuliridis TaxID=452529 RepID=A0ACD4ZE12_9ACTN|nr:ATP-binding protein [Streptomyces scopuliridis]WSB32452.1 ATP-binding protein [Streptomyces scopuliridis]WSB96699.1 ATP-binding protein [Streptomyces scopuliridis]WSC09597.1 ATP-binding protein [Streptomyces scopuliridis]